NDLASSAAASSARLPTKRACSPSAITHEATFAACPPVDTRASTGVSAPGASGPGARTITSRSRSPRVQTSTAYNRVMDREPRAERLRSFLLGGLVGASAVIAAARRRRQRRRVSPPGLAAFEDAPCYRGTLERESRPEPVPPLSLGAMPSYEDRCPNGHPFEHLPTIDQPPPRDRGAGGGAH